MDKCLLISCLVLAQIRHNGKNYQVGDVVCLSVNDKLFLEKAKYVRTATPDEVAEFEQKQTDANQSGADNPPNANSNSHLDNRESVGNDSEPSPPVNEPTQPQAEPQPSEGTPPADPVSMPDPAPVLAYDKLTKAELITQLTARGIAHNPKAKNDELVALLVADDNKAIPLEIEDEE